MPLAILEHLELYRDPQRFCGNPNLTRLADGALLLGFRWADGRLRGDWDPSLRPVQMMAESVEGLAHAQPRVIHDADSTLTPYAKQLADGRLLCAVNRWRVASGPELARYPGLERREEGTGVAALPAPILILRSTDRARTWEALAEIALPDEFGPGCGFRGNMVELDDGSVLFAIWGRRRPPALAATSVLMRSSDRGATWRKLSTIADDPTGEVGFNETFLYRTLRGDLVAFLRTSGAEGHLFTARSADGGLTWSPPTDELIYGFPHDVLRLSTGELLLSYGCRQAPYGTRARLIDPDCGNIASAPEVVIRGDGFNGATGYPAAVEIDSGLVLVAYYHNTAGELPWIGGTLLAAS